MKYFKTLILRLILINNLFFFLSFYIINMDVFNQNLYIKIIKIILHRFDNKNKDEFIFLGDIDDNIKEIIDKIISNKTLNESDKKNLEITYGNEYKDIKNLINKNTELIYESIFPDDNIQTLKKKYS